MQLLPGLSQNKQNCEISRNIPSQKTQTWDHLKSCQVSENAADPCAQRQSHCKTNNDENVIKKLLSVQKSSLSNIIALWHRKDSDRDNHCKLLIGQKSLSVTSLEQGPADNQPCG